MAAECSTDFVECHFFKILFYLFSCDIHHLNFNHNLKKSKKARVSASFSGFIANICWRKNGQNR
jgi:hypothetical protein